MIDINPPISILCYSCNKPISENNFGRSDTCETCRRDTRVCRNCIFYEITYNNSCRESAADRIVDKEKSNFCDYFKPIRKPMADGLSPELSPAERARMMAEALFKKKP